ncbi:Ig-like domain-containing protein [Patescibacteria group bacterium]
MKKYFLFILIIGVFLAVRVEAAAPDPISNLSCVYSEETGTVYLTWTPPAGVSGYEVRYFYSSISESNFNNVYKFDQNWLGSTNKGLVYPLTLDNYWFFAIKSINNIEEISGISNVISCYISTSTTQAQINTVPVSSIINPSNGAAISAGENYTILGESYDVGGSSIQKVEISFDGGNTWNLTTPKTATGTGFTFEYLWQNSAVGSYNIRTKATDWRNIIEVPTTGINITVVSQDQQATSTPPSDNQNTVEFLKVKITQLQQQIVQLLQQIIQILQQQLGTS